METGRLAVQVNKALSALAMYETKSPRGRPSKAKVSTVQDEVGDDCSAVYLVVGLNKMAERTSLKPVKLPIPHPFRRADDENLSVCLLTKDPQRYYKDLISPLSLPAISKIQGISKLRAKFKPFEAKRNLCGAFDLFLADSRITPLLPKLLGKTFIAKKKQPVPVRLEDVNPERLKEKLKEAVEATYCFITGGSNVSIRAGNISQEQVHIAANIEAILKLLAKKLPEGLKSIRSVHLKTRSSVALPVFIRKASNGTAGEEN